MKNYRKVWESYNGQIPKDKNGRSYEIHHSNGNHEDNRIENLQCISIEDHYNIHYQQGDWAACMRISTRLGISPEIKSELASKSNAERLENGTHPFLNPQYRKNNKEAIHKMLSDGSHPFLIHNRKPEWQDKANDTYSNNYDRSVIVTESWKEWKLSHSEEDLYNRTSKGSKMGASITIGTKWYHKTSGEHLRTTPDDIRILNEGWILGRFNGSDKAKEAALKYSSKGIKRSDAFKLQMKDRNDKLQLLRFKQEWIEESIDNTNNRWNAVLYFNNNFGKISYPTFVKMEKLYYINKK